VLPAVVFVKVIKLRKSCKLLSGLPLICKEEPASAKIPVEVVFPPTVIWVLVAVDIKSKIELLTTYAPYAVPLSVTPFFEPPVAAEEIIVPLPLIVAFAPLRFNPLEVAPAATVIVLGPVAVAVPPVAVVEISLSLPSIFNNELLAKAKLLSVTVALDIEPEVVEDPLTAVAIAVPPTTDVDMLLLLPFMSIEEFEAAKLLADAFAVEVGLARPDEVVVTLLVAVPPITDADMILLLPFIFIKEFVNVILLAEVVASVLANVADV
jgi:hypothetical protein